jgi:hypothetical protein
MPDEFIIDNMGGPLSPRAGIKALAEMGKRKEVAAAVQMTIQQYRGYEVCGIEITSVVTCEGGPGLIDLPERLMTFGGFPVEIRENMPKDEIHFVNYDGETIGKITNLGIPELG